ncbi:translocation/assembly module TamB domain-containing protein [Arthrospiribacter ruber]|uniref:Translocation/assembly module TamB n=1 Tax=Arthrospiribacter ruber TaxID=2487934 RepID=A0A951J074_9BACT|nr:translocation/assembly module TamB domain-containing protein [Arthrospiribacter ruber]MBW3468543.1 translocation/assembly module TamB [Arthrospiribacter ruber]
MIIKKYIIKFFKILGITLAVILFLVVALILFIRSPWGQDIIVQKATTYVSDQTKTRVDIERLFITFSGNLYLEGLFLEDQKGDTLLYSKNLETGVSILPLIRTGEIKVSKLYWEGLRANVNRDSVSGQYNFDFFIEAFVEESEESMGDAASVSSEEPSDFPKLTVGPVDLKDFRISYFDGELGIDLNAYWEEIKIRLDEVDLNKMNFGISEAAILNSRINYLQFRSFPPSEPSESSELPPPLLSLGKFSIKNADWKYESVPDGIDAELILGDFWIELPEADLESQKIMVKSLGLHESDIRLKMTEIERSEAEAIEDLEGNEGFEWPEWIVEVGNIDIENNSLGYQLGDAEPTVGLFNPDNILLNNFNFQAHSLHLRDEKAGLVLDEFTFEEQSGFGLETFAFDFKINDKQLNIEDFKVKSNSSSIEASLALEYSSLERLIEHPDRSKFRFELITLNTDASEALFFAPELEKEGYFRELMKNGIVANGSLSGDLSSLDIPRLRMAYGPTTSLQIDGLSLRNYLDTEKLRFDLGQLVFESDEKSLNPFLEDLELDYDIPKTLVLRGNARGSLEELETDIELKTSDGNVMLQAEFLDQQPYKLHSSLELDELDLGKILKMPDLKPISLKMTAEGEGNGLYDLRGKLKTDVDQLQWGDYDLSSLIFTVEAKDTMADLVFAIEKDILDIKLEALARLDTVNPELIFSLDLKHLETQAMRLTAQDITTRMKLEGEVSGSLDDIKAKLRLEEAFMYYERQAYPIGEIALEARLSDAITTMSIKSDFLKGQAEVNGSAEALTESMQTYLSELVSGEVDTLADRSIKAKGEFQFSPTPFIDQLLVSGIEELDTVSITFDFDAERAILNAQVYLPLLEYTDVKVRSFELDLDGDANSLSLSAGFRELIFGPIDMGETSLTGTFQENDVRLDFLSLYNEEPIIDLKSVLKFEGDTLIYHINPEGLIFNSRSWQMPENNAVYYAENYLSFEDFAFTRNNQELRLSNEVLDTEDEQIGVLFKDFNLSTFTSFLNPDDPLVKGIANGEFVAVNPWDAIGVLADFRVNDLEVMEIPLGTLTIDAEARTLQEYDFSLALKEGMIDLDLDGVIEANQESSLLDLELKLNELKMAMIDKFAGDEIRNTEGYISGNVRVTGSFQEPVYEGTLDFNEVSLVVSQLNNKFSVSEDQLRVDNSGLYFEDFDIRDESGQEFNIDGKIDTEDFSQIGLDLKIRSENFQVLNSTREDNDLFFGRANINLDMDVKGTTELPELDVRLRINRGTNFTFIVPESQLELVERTGVVIFVNHADPYDVMNQRENEISTQGIQGFDVKANLQIDPEAVFNVVVDERTGDNLRLQGEADLNMLMNPNGNISLSGRYEVRSGHYELNLYNLVSRRFELAEGSSILWNGDPLDASLNLRAIYNVRTSAAELMQAQLSGSGPDTRSQFRQVLRFQVFLKVDGDLMQPQISFELDMQEQDRGAFGGAVYSTVQQLNENEDEVTKQVFALLVLNQFFPTMGNDGSTGGSVNLARSSVSQVLSSQLNALSDRLFGESGFSLDMDLDSFTDYQNGGPEDRTQLNVAARQRLFDDRLVISVGGQMDVEGGSRESVNQGDALFGDVSLEYLLDTRGQWRAKAYRRNQFESVIDGQLIVTGLSFIFNREFNAFKELWRKREIDEAIEENELELIDDFEETENP